VIVPGVPVERTMASTLPLKAFRLVPLYDAVSIGLPLSTPTSWPGPDTANVTGLAAVGTRTPLASWMSPVTNARSRPSAAITSPARAHETLSPVRYVSHRVSGETRTSEH
jgi:hypothetical protein